MMTSQYPEGYERGTFRFPKGFEKWLRDRNHKFDLTPKGLLIYFMAERMMKDPALVAKMVRTVKDWQETNNE